jgi:hypothetical protein
LLYSRLMNPTINDSIGAVAKVAQQMIVHDF